MSKSSKQAKNVSRWLDASDRALLQVVREAASSTSHPTSSLVLAAQATLSIVDAVRDAQDVAPEVQLLIEHAIRVVGLLCRAYMVDADGRNWHIDVGQILVDLLILLPKVLNLVKGVRIFDGFRTRAYLEELQTFTVQVASLVIRHRIRLEGSAVSPELSVEPKEEPETTAPRRNAKGRAGAHTDGTHTTTSVDQADAPFAPPPMHVPHPAPSLLYPAGYLPPPFPPLPYGTTHPFPPALSMAQAFPTSGSVYFYPYAPQPSMLWNNNCGNTQNINITNHNHYAGTSGQGPTRRRESSVLNQVRMAQEIVLTISPPCLNVPPPPAVLNYYPPYIGHPFMPGPPMQCSTPPGGGPHPASSFPPSLSNLDTRTVPNYGAMNSTPDSHENGSSSSL